MKKLSISNFKSIKELNIDCNRINIFIGKPNVGKSNLLEALSLFNIPYILSDNVQTFAELIRFKNLKNLFFDNITKENIEVHTDIGSVYFRYHNNFDYDLIITPFKEIITKFQHQNSISDLVSSYSTLLETKENIDSKNIKLFYQIFYKNANAGHYITQQRSDFYSSIRKYTYNGSTPLNDGFQDYLKPPHGINLTTIIQNNQEIFNEISSFFEDYQLDLLYDIENNLFEIQKKVKKVIYKYPFQLLADTLLRIIFYLTVVETNKNAVILLEEPETHSFPPYTKLLAEKIANKKDNQFFISTHSPYLLNNIIENTDLKDLGVFITYLDNYQTKVKKLSQKDIRQILDDYIDVFFNLDKFLNYAG